MKKFFFKSLAIGLLALFPAMSWAQTSSTLTVNDGTVTNSFIPTYGMYVDTKGQRSQFIIPADKLESLGEGAVITAIEFYCNTASVSWGSAAWKVSMMEPSTSTLFNTLVGATTVYQGSLSVTSSKMSITLSSSYTYGGGDLLFSFDVTNAGSWKSASFYGVSTGTARYNSGSGSGTAQTFSPKMTITYTPGEPPSCAKPGAITVKNITSSSADLSWTAGGTETAWEVDCNGTKSIVETTPAKSLTGLIGNTTYNVSIRAICGVGDTSQVRSTSFKTECGQIQITKETPFVEGFELNWPTTSSEFADCWNRITATVYSSTYPYCYNSSYYAHGGSKSMYFNGGTGYTTSYLILPEIATDLRTLTIEFYYKNNYEAQDYGQFAIGTMSDPSKTSTFNKLADIDRKTEYTKYELNLANAVEGDSYIAIKYYNGSSTTYAYIDDITVKVSPSCQVPSALSVGGIGTDFAMLSWTAGKNETQWNVQYKQSNASSWTTIDTVITTLPFKLQGLQSGTNYDFKVRAYCSADDQSEYSASKTFMTACDAKTIPYTENFDGMTTSSTGSPKTPYCWEILGANESNTPYIIVSNNSSYRYSYANCLYFQNGTTKNGYAIFPEMAEDLNKLEISFRYIYTSTNGKAQVDFGYLTDIADSTTFEVLLSLPKTNTISTLVEDFELTGIPSDVLSTARLAFRIGTGTSGREFGVDDIEIKKIPTCKKISDVAASEPTAHGAKIKWTTQEAPKHQILVTKVTVSDPNNVSAADTIYNVIVDSSDAMAGEKDSATISSPLIEDNTQYRVWVRGYCGGTDFGEWAANIASFKTTCDAFAAADLAVTTFENNAVNKADLDCWTDYSQSSGGYGYKSTYAAQLRKDQGQDFLLTPVISDAISGLYVGFFAKAALDNAGLYQDSIEVGVCTDGTSATYTKLKSFVLSTEYQFYEMNLTGASADANKIVFSINNPTTKYRDVYVDSIMVKTTQVLVTPLNIRVTNNVANSATVAWDGGDEADKAYVATAEVTDPESKMDWVAEVDEVNNTATFTTSSYTKYYVYVKTSSGVWSKTPLVFTSACAIYALPYSEDFEGGATGSASNPNLQCWDLLNANGSNQRTIYRGSNTNYYKGTKSLYFSTYSPKTQDSAVAVLPEMSYSHFDLLKIKFDYKASAYLSNILTLGYMTDLDDASSFVAIKNPDISNSWKTDSIETIELGEVTGARLVFRFNKWTGSSSSSQFLGIDNIVVEEVMPRPTDVTVVPTTTTVNFTIDQKYEEMGNNWHYVVATNKAYTEGVVEGDVTSKQFSLSLAKGQTFYLKVRFENTTTSKVSSYFETSFTSFCEEKKLPFTDGFATEVSPCWNVISGQASLSSQKMYCYPGGYFLPVCDYEGLSLSDLQIQMNVNTSSSSTLKIVASNTLDLKAADLNNLLVLGTFNLTSSDSYAEVYMNDVQGITDEQYVGFVTSGYIYVDSVTLKQAENRLPVFGEATVTYNSATIPFTQKDDDEGGWIAQYSKNANFSGATEVEIDADATKQVEMTGLDANTTYYVRLHQAMDDDQHWATTSVTTLCAPTLFNTIYGFEDFNATSSKYCYSGTSTYFSSCWSRGSLYNSGNYYLPYAYSGTKYEGNNCMIMWGYVYSGYYSTSDYAGYFAMPAFAEEQDMTEVIVTFYAKADNASYNTLQVGTTSGITATNKPNFTKVDEVQLTTGWVQYTVKYEDYSGTDQQIMFYYNAGAASSYPIYIDNIEIKKVLCKNPKPAVSSITSSSAVLANGLTTGADWAWKFEGGEETLVDGAKTSTDLTGLEEDTQYTVQVQARCGGENGNSDWKSVTFRTRCTPVQAAGYVENFDNPTDVMTCMVTINAKADVADNVSQDSCATFNDNGILTLPEFESTTNYEQLILTFVVKSNWDNSPVNVIAFNETDSSYESLYEANTLKANYTPYEIDLGTIADINTKLAGKRLGFFRQQMQTAYVDSIALTKKPADVLVSGTYAGKIGTYCPTKNVSASSIEGGAFFVPNQKYSVGIEFISVDELKAGYGYIYQADGEQITGITTGEEVSVAETDMAKTRGMQGVLGSAYVFTTGSEDYCLISNNKLQFVGDNNTIPAGRAYIVKTYVDTLEPMEEEEPSAAPRRRLIIGGKGTATGIADFVAEIEGIKKLVVNDQLIIVRDGKAFNAQGQAVR